MIVDPDVATNWLEFAIAVLTFLVVIAGVVTAANKFQERRIRALVVAATYPIQNHANGGRSLPDIAQNVDLLMRNQIEVLRNQGDLIQGQAELRSQVDAGNLRVHESLGKVHARLDGHINDHLKEANAGRGCNVDN
jgi:hypothetical protein